MESRYLVRHFAGSVLRGGGDAGHHRRLPVRRTRSTPIYIGVRDSDFASHPRAIPQNHYRQPKEIQTSAGTVLAHQGRRGWNGK